MLKGCRRKNRSAPETGEMIIHQMKMEKKITEAEKFLTTWEPTKIHFGEGIVTKIGEIVKKYGDRTLIVIGEGSTQRSGLLDRVVQSLERNSINHKIVVGVEPNPSKETVYRIVYHLLTGEFNCLLAIGGGSVIDATKAANILGTIKAGELDDYFGLGMVSQIVENLLPLIAIPTTSGSGSEVTKFSVITDPRLHVKKLIVDKAIIPKEAIVDPELTYSCSEHVTKVSGLDTLVHLIEGYFNKCLEGEDPEVDQRALVGLELVFEGLPRVLKDGQDREARKMMSLASTLGGSVFLYKQAGLPHLNSFSWSHVLDHGEAVAVMLPYYAAFYAPEIMDKVKNVAKLMGIPRSDNPKRDFAEGLFDFYRKINFPVALKEFKNFSKELINKAIHDAYLNKVKFEISPRYIPEEKRKAYLQIIIEGAFKGSIDEIIRL